MTANVSRNGGMVNSVELTDVGAGRCAPGFVGWVLPRCPRYRSGGSLSRPRPAQFARLWKSFAALLDYAFAGFSLLGLLGRQYGRLQSGPRPDAAVDLALDYRPATHAIFRRHARCGRCRIPHEGLICPSWSRLRFMNTRQQLFVAAVCIVSIAVAAAAQSGRARPAPPPSGADAGTAADASAPAADPPAKKVERSAPVSVNAHYDTKYAGGTVAFEKDAKTKVTIKDGVISFTTKNAKYEVPAEKVTEMSYGQNVRQRLAEGVGVGVLVPGLGGIIGRSKSTAHYIEILWDVPPNGGVALRVDKGDYRGLIAALEGATGVKVDIEAQPGPIDWP